MTKHRDISPEPMDFAAVAQPLIDHVSLSMDPTTARDTVVEYLRLIWNARGEADILTLVPILADTELAVAVPALQAHDRHKRL